MLSFMTPTRLENTGTATAGVGTAFSFLTISEWLAISTFIMGVITFIIGRIYGHLDRKQKEQEAKAKAAKDELDIERKKVQLAREKKELEALEQELIGFKKRKLRENGEPYSELRHDE